MRRSVVAKYDIDKNVEITDDMIALKRPSSGISPMYLDEIIGKKTQNKLLKGQIFKFNDKCYTFKEKITKCKPNKKIVEFA